MRTIYVFGNEYLSYDSMASAVAVHLKGVTTVHCRSPEELLEVTDEEILILDVVKGAKSPLLITDTKKLKTRGLTSLHDMDLGFFLSLVDSLDMHRKVLIIGVPEAGDERVLAAQVMDLLQGIEKR